MPTPKENQLMTGQDLLAPFCSRSADTPETDLREFQFRDEDGVHLFAVHSAFARRLERDLADLTQWVRDAAPLLNKAACIVAEDSITRLGEILGVRAVIESCPVDFISENTE